MKTTKPAKNAQIGLFSRVSTETKSMFEDIVYALDMKSHAAIEAVIQYYYEKEGIKPRPSKKRSAGK
jgi:hypothetical protein